MIKQTMLSLIGVIIIGSAAYAADAPTIISISPEEVCGSFSGVRPTIDIDSQGQPHIIVDSGHVGLGSTLAMFNRIGGSWRSSTFATRTSEGYSPSAISQPWMAIDSQDRMWVFAQFFQAGVMANSGQGVWLYNNMTTSPTKSWFHKKQYGQYGWGPGNIDIDPAYPDEAVVMTINGDWGKVNSSGTTIGTGRMGPVLSGEKFRFRIAPNPDGRTRGVWHGVMNGSSARHSSYRNSLMTADAVWASHNPYYPSQGDDHNHAGVCGDLKNPEIGYMAAVYEDGGSHNGLQFNVWRGNAQRFAYPSQQLGILDLHATFIHRYAPALTPAHGDAGGCWAAWGNEHGEIWLAYIDQAGQVLGKEHVANGFTCAINTDEDGNIHMAYNNGGYVLYRVIRLTPGTPDVSTAPADFDGDGIDDITIFDPDNGGWHMRLSSNGYANVDHGNAGDQPVPADYDGDGIDDVAVYRAETFTWYIKGSTAGAYQVVFGEEGDIPLPGCYNTAGTAVIAVYRPSNGYWYHQSASGALITRSDLIAPDPEAVTPVPADYDGDGITDIGYVDQGVWNYVRSIDSGKIIQAWGAPTDIPIPIDVDGDDKDDLCVFRASTGTWYAWGSTAGGFTAQWGAPGDTLAPGDYDGDGKSDLTVYRENSGNWYVRSSLTEDLLESSPVQWGSAVDASVPADYDFDGKADVAVFRAINGNWYIRGSAGINSAINWGAPGDKPVANDYDGDGNVDIAVYRPSTGRWYARGSSNGLITAQWGAITDQPVSADYDFDGKADFAVFRENNGNWYIRGSAGTNEVINWGAPGDIPVPYDYDNDGKVDVAIFRPSTGDWHVRSSATNDYAVNWGAPGDIPVPGLGQNNIAIFRASDNKIYVAGEAAIDIGTDRLATPSAKDFDGDGTNDPCIFENATGTWWARKSSDEKWLSGPSVIGWSWSRNSIPIGGHHTN